MINLFENKFCINLDHRKDKWEESQEEFRKHNILNVNRFSAIYGNPDNLPHNMQQEPILTNIGVTLSHLRILEYAEKIKPNYISPKYAKYKKSIGSKSTR